MLNMISIRGHSGLLKDFLEISKRFFNERKETTKGRVQHLQREN